MAQDPIAHGFLTEPDITPEIQASYDSDVADHGYVMNLSRVWAQMPPAHDKLFALVADAGGNDWADDRRASLGQPYRCQSQRHQPHRHEARQRQSRRD